MENQKSFRQLLMPIFFETLLLTLAGIVDTLMLSTVSDNAVGAVGTANTYISVFIIMFGIVTTGMTAVMTQNIGANKPGIAYQARQISLYFNGVLGVVFSLSIGFFSKNILEMVGIAPALIVPADEYLKPVGWFVFLNALIPVFSGYLRAFGYSKQSLTAALIANGVNLVLNAVSLFILKWGVFGVALATVISRVVNLLILIIQSFVYIHAKSDTNRLDGKIVFGQIIKVGLPGAFENTLWNVEILLVTRFLNQMDTDGLNVTARSYQMQISNFSYCMGYAISQANAIVAGWKIGENKLDECDRGTKKASIYGILSAVIVSAFFALCSSLIMRIFSNDREIISLVQKLLLIDIALEMGKVTNLIYGTALKTSGDAVFPAILGIVFMYLCGVLGAYIFGIKLGLNAIGVMIGLALDEIVRACGMFLRWKSGKWRKKLLVSAK